MEQIVIFNRRCIKHPEKGGAEFYTYHLAKALLEKGKKVEWFSSRFKGAKKEEFIDGIRFIRRGNELTTHFYGFLYAFKARQCLVIDEFNGTGFFTFPFRNSILLIHQLYEEFWTAELGILGFPFKYMEKFLLRLYRKTPSITVSNSTANDLKVLGFKDIHVIPNGVEIEHCISLPEKDNTLSLIYLGRLKKTKNPEDAIKAFLLVKKIIPEVSLNILGDGPLMEALKRKYEREDGIYFKGYVDNSEKFFILKKSHFLLVPSIREGWGQVVIQANAVGTPAVGYNVHGLRDSIIDGQTGMLVRDYKEMAEAVIKIWQNRGKYNEISQESIEWAKNFSWEKTRAEIIKYLKEKGFIN